MSDEIRSTKKDEQEIRRLQARAGGMLPGVALISMFMIFMTIVNAFVALRGDPPYTTHSAKYSGLAICSILAIGVFGLLRLKKWGWAIVSAGCLLLSSGLLFFFEKTKDVTLLIRGLLVLVFFLYLVRSSVRERLR
jgi:hypothetical protein